MRIGTFLHVDSKGTYLEPKGELGGGPPTELSFLSYAISPGDYIGLRGVGSFSAGGAYPDQRGLVACFFAFGVGGPIAPGKHGQDGPVHTPNTWPLGNSTDIDQDFGVPQDRVVIVRAPEMATRLVFSVPDAYFPDNGADGDFGVLITFPNRPTATPGPPGMSGSVEGSAIDREFGAVDTRALIAALNERAKGVPEWPEATTFAASPFEVDANTATRPQYRGWYVPNTWVPQMSHFDPNGTGGRAHYGMDIFAPRGSQLIVPVGPSYVEYLPNVSGYGGTIAFRFTWQSKRYTAIYAHCDSFLFPAARTAQAGELVGTAGCSGNASQENCGIDLAHGGRTDHVHVGLYEGATIADKASPIDPATILGWAPITPS